MNKTESPDPQSTPSASGGRADDLRHRDGLELLQCAKRRNACTQVLFMTGHSTQEALLVALERGASDYLLKPVDQTELIELLKQSYQRQRRWKKALLGTWRSGHEPSTTAVG